MINKLSNYTRKSFKNFTNPSDLLFREKNIFFGYNGKGKSSFAVGLKEEFLKNTLKKEDNVRLFNKGYIADSLILENSEGRIKGVEAHFGRQNVEIENKIKDLEKEVVSQVEINKLSNEIDNIRREIRKEIDSIHDRRKGKANIQKKSKEVNIDRVISLYEDDYKNAKKVVSDDDELIKIEGDNTIEEKRIQLESLNQLSFLEISTADIDAIKLIFDENFGEDIVIPAFEIVRWLEEGVKIHREGDNCKFCGGELDFLAVNSKLEQYKDNKRHKAKNKLIGFKKQLQTLKNDIGKINELNKTYIAIIGSGVNQDFEVIQSVLVDIDLFINPIQNKIENLDDDEVFDYERFQILLKNLENSVKKIDDLKNKQLSDYRNQESKFSTIVKGAIGLEIINSSSFKDKLKEIRAKEANLKTKHESNEIKLNEIQALKQQKSSTKEFADFVSQILIDINISLKVQLDNDNLNYIIKSSHDGSVLTIQDISEGEKNLLALLFFYYQLFNDSDQLIIKNEIEIIIVDDPISSMDDSNKFYILELMKNLLNLPDKQVFIFTHCWDDFCSLSYGRKAWEDKKDEEGNIIMSSFATFEVRKVKGISCLIQLNKIERPYKYLFKEIYKFSKKSDEDILTDCEIFHYPNVMRRVFEEWYSFKIGKDLNLTSNQQGRLENDFELKSSGKKAKLGIFLKVCNILSHSINSSKNQQEIHQSAKFLMKLIEDNDSLHFNSMKQ